MNIATPLATMPQSTKSWKTSDSRRAQFLLEMFPSGMHRTPAAGMTFHIMSRIRAARISVSLTNRELDPYSTTNSSPSKVTSLVLHCISPVWKIQRVPLHHLPLKWLHRNSSKSLILSNPTTATKSSIINSVLTIPTIGPAYQTWASLVNIRDTLPGRSRPWYLPNPLQVVQFWARRCPPRKKIRKCLSSHSSSKNSGPTSVRKLRKSHISSEISLLASNTS